MAKGFDMVVRAYDPYLARTGWPEGDVAEATDVHEALAWADCVSVHAPRGERPILGADEIASMKPGIILANTSRGGVVDEQALAGALASGKVGAAGIDVFDIEPPDGGSPLARLDNVVLSPHAAGMTEEAARRMALVSIENAMRYLDGTIDRRLVVNPEQLHV
jgi:D-3-phosphoglycerate dehydrogenase